MKMSLFSVACGAPPPPPPPPPPSPRMTELIFFSLKVVSYPSRYQHDCQHDDNKPNGDYAYATGYDTATATVTTAVTSQHSYKKDSVRYPFPVKLFYLIKQQQENQGNYNGHDDNNGGDVCCRWSHDGTMIEVNSTHADFTSVLQQHFNRAYQLKC